MENERGSHHHYGDKSLLLYLLEAFFQHQELKLNILNPFTKTTSSH